MEGITMKDAVGYLRVALGRDCDAMLRRRLFEPLAHVTADRRGAPYIHRN